jgi:hypothetical protein
LIDVLYWSALSPRFFVALKRYDKHPLLVDDFSTGQGMGSGVPGIKRIIK